MKWAIVFEYKNKGTGIWEKVVKADTKEKAMENLRSEIPEEIIIIRVNEAF